MQTKGQMKNSTRRIMIGTVSLIALAGAIWFGYQLQGTGFGVSVSSTGEVIPAKTLWEWMELILVPVVLFFLARYYTEAQRSNEEKRTLDREQAEILQTYIDRMQTLILDKKLLEANDADPVVSIARTLTLTSLKRLLPEHKATVLIFIDEMGLIQGGKARIISLVGAELRGVGSPLGLVHSDMSGSDLRFAKMGGAKLDFPNFQNADLEAVEFMDASLIGGDFRGANLLGADLLNANLFNAVFDTNTVLPNGKKWNETKLTDFGAVFHPPYTDQELEQTRKEFRMDD